MDLRMGCQSGCFNNPAAPIVELPHACLPLLLKLCLALVQSNYHLLLVVCSCTLRRPLALITLHSHLTCGLQLPCSGHFLRPFALFCTWFSAHYANQHSLLAQHCGNKCEPLVFHYKDACQAGFSFIRENFQGLVDVYDKDPSQGHEALTKGKVQRTKDAHYKEIEDSQW